MKLRPRYNSKIIAGLLLPAVLSICPMHAADTVRLSDLPERIGQGKLDNQGREDREYTIITKAGTTYRSRHVMFIAGKIELSSGLMIPIGDLAQIRVKHHKEWSYAIAAPGLAMCGDGEIFLTPLAIPLIPALLVVTAVTAPVTISVEGVKRLLPAKVITVKP